MYQMAFRVLEILDGAAGPVSGDVITSRLGISRSTVWKQVQLLKEMGYDISASPGEGYLLRKASDRLLPYEVHKRLRTTLIGKQMRYYPSTPSTSGIARDLCIQSDPKDLNGLVLIAEEQTGGVGRLGRVWVSPAGGIWVSIILTPGIAVGRAFMITMAGSIAVARAIRKEYDLGALIKWPNDIQIGDRKVAGILLELSTEGDAIRYCLLGIGVDANIKPDELPHPLPQRITSLSTELGRDVDRAALLARILKEFESRYLLIESGEYETIVLEWKSLSSTLDQRVQITTMRSRFEGEAIDIDEFGALLVRRDSGKVERVIAGDCLHT